MAQLKNTLVTGNLKITNKTTTDSLQVTTVYAKANSTATTYGVGTNGQVLKSNGTMTYWATDANDNQYDRLRYQKAILASTAITAKNIIVPNSSGAYYHLKSGSAFDIRFPILYAGSNIAQSATGTNNYIVFPIAIATTQSMTLTAYQPVYIKGTLLGKAFTPVSTTPLTQTVPTTEDGYHYMLLGLAYNTTEMYLLEDHNIYEFSNGYFRKLGDDTSKTLRYDLTNKTVDLNALTLGDNSKISERHYICYSSGGSTAISNKPDSNNISFILDVYQLRWTSTTDFYVVQIYEDIYFHKFRRRKTSSTAAWTAWKRIPDEGDYYTSAICDDAADIQNKAARFDSYVLRVNNIFQLSIGNGNSYAGAWTLNVNDTGAKTVYINGSISSSSNYNLTGGIYNVMYCSDDNYHLSTAAFPIPDSGFRGRYTQGPINICCRSLSNTLKTSFKTNVLGQTGNANFISTVRCASSTSTTDISPAYSPAIAFGYGDTHAYLNIGYGGSDNDKKVFVAGGNANTLLWDARVFTTADPPKTTEIVPGSSIILSQTSNASTIKIANIWGTANYVWICKFRLKLYTSESNKNNDNPYSFHDIIIHRYANNNSHMLLQSNNFSCGSAYLSKIIFAVQGDSNVGYILLTFTNSVPTGDGCFYKIEILEQCYHDNIQFLSTVESVTISQYTQKVSINLNTPGFVQASIN